MLWFSRLQIFLLQCCQKSLKHAFWGILFFAICLGFPGRTCVKSLWTEPELGDMRRHSLLLSARGWQSSWGGNPISRRVRPTVGNSKSPNNLVSFPFDCESFWSRTVCWGEIRWQEQRQQMMVHGKGKQLSCGLVTGGEAAWWNSCTCQPYWLNCQSPKTAIKRLKYLAKTAVGAVRDTSVQGFNPSLLPGPLARLKTETRSKSTTESVVIKWGKGMGSQNTRPDARLDTHDKNTNKHFSTLHPCQRESTIQHANFPNPRVLMGAGSWDFSWVSLYIG